MWAWTFFRASVKIPEDVDKFELAVKATDRYACLYSSPFFQSV